MSSLSASDTVTKREENKSIAAVETVEESSKLIPSLTKDFMVDFKFDGKDELDIPSGGSGNRSMYSKGFAFGPQTSQQDCEIRKNSIDRRYVDDCVNYESDYLQSGYGVEPNRHFYGGRNLGSRFVPSERDTERAFSYQSQPVDIDFRSPRSGYDLAFPSTTTNLQSSSQWDRMSEERHSNLYDPTSPRLNNEQLRWDNQDHYSYSLYDEQDRHFSPSLRENRIYSPRPFRTEPDSLPSSYTYGMRQPQKFSVGSGTNGYTVSFSSPIRNGECRSNLFDYDDNRIGRYPDLSSPQPTYSNIFSDSEFAYGFHDTVTSTIPQNRSAHAMQNVGNIQPSNPRCVTESPVFPAKTATIPASKTAVDAEKPMFVSSTSPISPVSPNTPVSPASINQDAEGAEETYSIKSQAIMQNQEERTVVLIRNIPNRYKLADLTRVISSSVDEEFSVLRLPIDAFTKRNLGYAFVKFSDSHEVLKLFLKMNNQRWPNSNSLKKFYMCYAKKQNYVLYEEMPENGMAGYL